MKPTLMTLALFFLPSFATAENQPMLPADLEKVRFKPVLKEQLPRDVLLRDDQGRVMSLGRYCDGGSKPVLVAFIQYRCPMLCNLILEGVVTGLRRLATERGFRVGEHFHVVIISFDQREGTDLAAAKKEATVEAYGDPGSAAGWHFMTGDKEAIRKLTEKAGFPFRYDPKTDQYAHDSGILLLTPAARISRYFFGIDYSPTDLYYGLIEASTHRIGQPVTDRLALLFCYSYNPAKGSYHFAVMNLVRLAGLVSVLGLGIFLLLLCRRERYTLTTLGGS